MSTLNIKDLSLAKDFTRNEMATIHGGMINLERQPKEPIDAGHGGGTSWEDGGMRGMHPTYAVDGSPAPVRPY